MIKPTNAQLVQALHAASLLQSARDNWDNVDKLSMLVAVATGQVVSTGVLIDLGAELRPRDTGPVDVRVCYKETATGEDYRVDLTLESLSLEGVVQALNQENARTAALDGCEATEWVGAAWVPSSSTTDNAAAAFVATCKGEEFFGSYLITGVVYTRFL